MLSLLFLGRASPHLSRHLQLNSISTTRVLLPTGKANTANHGYPNMSSFACESQRSVSFTAAYSLHRAPARVSATQLPQISQVPAYMPGLSQVLQLEAISGDGRWHDPKELLYVLLLDRMS